MSANRRTNDPDQELTFAEFVKLCERNSDVRVQGKVESKTKSSGRLVRFNRAVRVDLSSVKMTKDEYPTVRVERLHWDRSKFEWVRTGVYMTVSWKLLDWVTWQLGGDPNGTWMKVTEVGDIKIRRAS